jgi:hypothetical protein
MEMERPTNMAADTYDSILGLILQGTGSNNNWGAVANNSMISPAARAIAGVNEITNTGGTVDLSTTILSVAIETIAEDARTIGTQIASSKLPGSNQNQNPNGQGAGDCEDYGYDISIGLEHLLPPDRMFPKAR